MAYALATRLLRAVKNSGLAFTEVAGWQSRGRAVMGSIETVTLHHTATPRSYRRSVDYPTMNVVKNGRSGLPGPLAQIGLGRSGHVYLIAAGRANHAGRSRATSMTNSHAIGIEAEGALEAWPAAQMRAYVLLVAALLTEFDLATGRALRHAETCSPPGRKIDASFDGPAFRRQVAAVDTSKNTSPAKEKTTMKRIGSGRRDPDLKLKAGQKRRVITNNNGVYRMCSPKKGQVIDGTVNLYVAGLMAGEVLRVRAVLALWNKKKKVTTIKHTYAAMDVQGTANGAKVHAVYPFMDGKCGYGSSGDVDATIQLEVENTTGHELDLTYIRYEILGS